MGKVKWGMFDAPVQVIGGGANAVVTTDGTNLGDQPIDGFDLVPSFHQQFYCLGSVYGEFLDGTQWNIPIQGWGGNKSSHRLRFAFARPVKNIVVSLDTYNEGAAASPYAYQVNWWKEG